MGRSGLGLVIHRFDTAIQSYDPFGYQKVVFERFISVDDLIVMLLYLTFNLLILKLADDKCCIYLNFSYFLLVKDLTIIVM